MMLEFSCPNRIYKVNGSMEFYAKPRKCGSCGDIGHYRNGGRNQYDGIVHKIIQDVENGFVYIIKLTNQKDKSIKYAWLWCGAENCDMMNNNFSLGKEFVLC